MLRNNDVGLSPACHMLRWVMGFMVGVGLFGAVGYLCALTCAGAELPQCVTSVFEPFERCGGRRVKASQNSCWSSVEVVVDISITVAE